MTTIAPCPFCGFDDVEIDEMDSEFLVFCPECLAFGPPATKVMGGMFQMGSTVKTIKRALGFAVNEAATKKLAA